jgi:hypothetical protein
MKRLGLVVVVALLLAACGGSEGQQQASPTTAATTTTAPAPGLPQFLAEVRQAGLGDKDLADPASQNAVVELGNTICDGIDDFGYGRIVQVVADSDAKPTPEEAATFVKSAVENLCPQHRDLLP